jgi:hypothetical protein
MSVYFRLRNTEIRVTVRDEMFFAANEMFLAMDEIVFAGILLFLPPPEWFHPWMEYFCL